MSKTSPSNVGGAGLNPDQRAKIPHALGQREKNPKQKKNRRNIVTTSIKTLKTVHSKKKKKNLK